MTVETLGAAVFSGQRMVGTLTGLELQYYHLLTHGDILLTYVVDSFYYRVSVRGHAKLKVSGEWPYVLEAHLAVDAMPLNGGQATEAEVAEALRTDLEHFLQKLQGMRSDPLGFGGVLVKRCVTLSDWYALRWDEAYPQAQVWVDVSVRRVENR